MKELLNAFCYAIFCIAGLLFWYFMMYQECEIYTNISTFIFMCLVLTIIVYVDMAKKVNKRMFLKYLLFGIGILIIEIIISIIQSLKRVFKSAKDDILN